MSRALLVLRNDVDRQRAKRWVDQAPLGTRVEFMATKRSLPQSAKMWAMLGELSTQLMWHGQRLSAEDWKLVMLDALKRELRIVPNVDGNGFVNLGRSSSRLTKQEFSDLLELISAFGANHGVKFHDSEANAA